MRLRLKRRRPCDMLAPQRGVAGRQTFLDILAPRPRKQCHFPAKGSGCVQSFHTDLGARLQWVFTICSGAVFLPTLHCITCARVHAEVFLALGDKKAHGQHGVMAFQMDGCMRGERQRPHGAALCAILR